MRTCATHIYVHLKNWLSNMETHSVTVSKMGQYSQQRQRVQHCHQHHEHQRGQQGQHDLSHQPYHGFPEGRIHKKNRSNERSVHATGIKYDFDNSQWVTTKGKQEFYWGLLGTLRCCAWMNEWILNLIIINLQPIRDFQQLHGHQALPIGDTRKGG